MCVYERPSREECRGFFQPAEGLSAAARNSRLALPLMNTTGSCAVHSGNRTLYDDEQEFHLVTLVPESGAAPRLR